MIDDATLKSKSLEVPFVAGPGSADVLRKPLDSHFLIAEWLDSRAT